MQPYPARSRKSPLFQAAGFGLLLGLLQLLLVFFGIARFGQTTVIVIGLILYLVIPMLAGLRARSSPENSMAGAGAGCVTGVVSACIVMLALIIAVVIALSKIPPPDASHPLAHPFPQPPSAIASIFLALAFLVNSTGVLLALIGGILGGLVSRKLR
jgi:hypothetical protein